MRERTRGWAEVGFTTVEMLIYIIIATVVITAVYQLLIGQNRLYTKQREVQDVRSSIRAAANLLAWELRQASASGGDLYSVASDSFTVRSVQGTGIVCGYHDTQPRIGLYATSGEFYATADDSLMVFAAGGLGTQDDAWLSGAVSNIWASGAGVDHCFWGDSSSIATELVLEVDTAGTPQINGISASGIAAGAPLRTFRRIQYGLYQEDGRWWLGRKVGSAAPYEKLTGPLSQPSDSGLVFVYYDSDGNTTSDPAQVALVDIIVRGESYAKVRQGGPTTDFVRDTLTLRVTVRG